MYHQTLAITIKVIQFYSNTYIFCLILYYLFLDFKTPLEPFEWDLIKEEDRKVGTTNNDNTEYNISP